jgi:hypothetical protein
MLENIEALAYIAPESIIDLHIIDNPLLSECDIDNICLYLQDPTGTVEIFDNADGCNSPEEVEEACLYISVPEYDTQIELTIAPNPLGGNSFVKYTLHKSSSVAVQILDLCGREVLNLGNEFKTVGEHHAVIDGSSVKPGVYFYVLKTKEGIQTMKMIKL